MSLQGEFHLRLTDVQHELLHRHLFPGDGLEALAFLICGRRAGGERHIFVAKELVLVPHSSIVRSESSITWSTSVLDELMGKIFGTGSAIVKLHSHPTGFDSFSSVDDRSDINTLSPFCTLIGDGHSHASAVMLPEGRIFGRVVSENGLGPPLASVAVIGDDIKVWQSKPSGRSDFDERSAQAFGSGTTNILKQLHIAVIGCSGTGSIVIEQLARLGVGHLVLVDPDKVEVKNLNRILNSSRADAERGTAKVDMLARAIGNMGLETSVTALAENLDNKKAVCAVAECDAVFGCMDSVEGRHLLNRLTTYYVLPYFDVGVRLDADGQGGINSIAGAVHYIQPGKSSLFSRRMYSMERLQAEGLKRTNPEIYAQECEDGYLRGVKEESPAVISINMLYAALAVNEFLARIHEYRNRKNQNFGYVGVSLSEMQFYFESEGGECEMFAKRLGFGDVEPLLGRASLS